MLSRMRVLALAFTLGACSSTAETTPDGADTYVWDEGIDTSSPPETSPVDTGTGTDTGAGDTIADAADGKWPLLGTVSGSCGEIASQLDTKAPSLDVDTLTFAPPQTYSRETLSPPGRLVFDVANAGGSSAESEIMSFELLHYCDGAELVKTETEISYAPPDDAGANTITDILVSIAGKKVGVSVTRAYKPAPMTMSDAEVQALLEKKLAGVNRSSVRVLAADKWVKQILHVWVPSVDMLDATKRVLPKVSADLRADTIVLVTRSVGGGFIYCDPHPALGTECPAL